MPNVLCGYHRLGLARFFVHNFDSKWCISGSDAGVPDFCTGVRQNSQRYHSIWTDVRCYSVSPHPLSRPSRSSGLSPAVLDAIDEAIERTAAVIAATERLREALLHELLTRGVPGWHTAWRDVPGLGTIPTDWDVVRLGEVCDVKSGLAMGPHRSPRDNPKPYLTVANVQADRVTLGEPRLMQLTDAEYSSRILLAGDIVLVEGHAQISQLGRAALVPPEADGYTFQNHLFRVRPGERCNAVFVCAYVNGRNGRRYFGSFGGTTSGLNTVSAANVRALPLPMPPIEEQRAMAVVLGGVNDAIERAREERDGLRSLKASAADALLTGRVRVPNG